MTGTGTKKAKIKAKAKTKKTAPAPVVVHINGTGGVDKDPAKIAHDQQVTWENKSTTKLMVITFIDGNPFGWNTNTVGAAGSLNSGLPVVPPDPERKYHYRVTPENALQGCDPIVIVQN